MSALVLRRAEVDGAPVDVRIEGGMVSALGAAGSMGGADVVIDCGGGALLPGLHDHHLHLLSMAAMAESVDVSRDLDRAIASAHRSAPPGAPIRAVHYDEVEEGPLDRWRLDALAPGRPVRVQHRSGALWVLSTAALEQVGARDASEPGVERDHLDRPTGRLFRLDSWLRERMPRQAPPDLAAVGRRLASCGVTGVTDCTPAASSEYFAPIADAVRSGALPVTVTVTGAPALSAVRPPPPLRRGPVKVIIADQALPPLDEVCRSMAEAHRAGRAVAVHCVTRSGLWLAIAGWRAVGPAPGDRVEHASVTPPEAVAALCALGVTVVTQPAFLAVRGDAYLAEVEPADQPDLYRCASLLEAGVPVGGSTDAPFGPDDPWCAIRCAVERRAPSGERVGSDRGLDPARAMALFLGPPERPGGPARRVAPGAPADLCLLDVPLRTALLEPSRRHVAMTIAAGRLTYEA